jgi:hypothetical protein
LSHGDRSRFGTDEHRRLLVAGNGSVHGTVLVDGMVRATWRLERDRAAPSVTLVVSHAGALTRREAGSVTAEGHRVLRFLEPDTAVGDVRLTALG